MSLPPGIEALIAAQAREIERLRAEVAELRRRLDLDSTTSSKPPSSDGLKKKPRLLGSLREPTGKPSGGQPGHKGDTLKRVAAPDRVVRHEAQACRHCRAALTASMQTGMERRQVFDLPERLIEVTEHQAVIYACPGCRGVTRAGFPDGVISPTQYGERIRAAAVYLNVQQLLPEDRTAQTLSDLIGAPHVCAASLTAWARKKAEDLESVYRAIGEQVGRARVRHLDETGFRIAGSLHWLHTTSSQDHTFYRVGATRGDVPEGLTGGVVVHDHFRPYAALKDVDHAYCNAHHLPGRTGPQDDQGEDENLGLVPNLRGRRRLRPPAIDRLDRPQTRLQYPPRPDLNPSQPPPSHRRLNQTAWELLKKSCSLP